MEEESAGLPLFPIIVALLVVLVAAGFYIVQLRADNAVLQAELALARQQSAAPAPAPQQAPVPAPPAAPAMAQPPASATGRVLSSAQFNTMVDTLRSETGAVREVWFAYRPNDPESFAFQQALQKAFEEAGWNVRYTAPASFSLRPGIFFLMADESPPSYVLTALAAFEAAGLEVSAGRDYRSFYTSKKAEDPNWRGFEMLPDQAYIVAVGAKPRA